MVRTTMTTNKSHEDQNRRSREEADRETERNKPAKPVPQESQKGQIAQYFKSQGKQPDDEILDIGGLKLRLKDLD